MRIMLRCLFNAVALALFVELVGSYHHHWSGPSLQEVAIPKLDPDKTGPEDWSSCIGAGGCNAGVRWRKYLGTYGKPSVQFVSCEDSCSASVDGGYTEWTPWTDCSADCGPGERSRFRLCIDPLPAFGGKECANGPVDTEIEPCNGTECSISVPINGNYSSWEYIGPCNVSCGNGTRTRERICNSPLPQNGGDECPNGHIERDEEPCEAGPCVDYTEWIFTEPCNGTNTTEVRFCILPRQVLGSCTDGDIDRRVVICD